MKKAVVLKLIKDVDLGNGITLSKNQEIEIVEDVVYINGNMLDTRYQTQIFNFVTNNKTLFVDVTRSW